jgi:drug/metabolite transporter (DMT)-like permease
LLAVLIPLGVKLPKGRRAWADLAVFGLFLTISNSLVTWSFQYLASGPGTLLISTTALWMAGLEGFRAGGARPGWLGWLGLAVGFGGVALLFEHSQGALDFRQAQAHIGMVLSALFWSLGAIYQRSRSLKINPVMSSAWQMLFSSPMMLLGSRLLGETAGLPAQTEGWVALALLVVFGSLVAFVSFVYMLDKLPAEFVGLYTYINPLVAVGLGWLLLGEPVARTFWAAGVLVLAGVFLVQRDKPKPAR